MAISSNKVTRFALNGGMGRPAGDFSGKVAAPAPAFKTTRYFVNKAVGKLMGA